MKRWRWMIASLLAAEAVVLVLFWPNEPRPCRKTFEQVREGMTREEVIETVGAPPGNYSTGNYVPSIIGWSWYRSDKWTCDEASLYVKFDDDAKVRKFLVRPHMRAAKHPTFIARIRSRIGL